MKKSLRKEIRLLAEDGIYIDGSHHKQWYLTEIFKLVGGKISEEMEMSTEEGIAP